MFTEPWRFSETQKPLGAANDGRVIPEWPKLFRVESSPVSGVFKAMSIFGIINNLQ